MPQPQHQPEQHELHRVVTPVDQPQLEAEVGELVIDTEAGRDQACADEQSMMKRDGERRIGA